MIETPVDNSYIKFACLCRICCWRPYSVDELFTYMFLLKEKTALSIGVFVVFFGLASCSGARSGPSNELPSVESAVSLSNQNISNRIGVSTNPVPVNLTYVLPTATTRSLSTQSIAHRHRQYISASNTKITITVTPVGSSTPSYGPTTTNCSTGAGNCNVSFTANPGANTIAFSLTDGTNVLSNFSTVTIVQPGILNTLSFTANPVVNSVVLQLASATENAGAPVNDLVTVNAKDIDNNTIVGNAPYVDVNGDPVTLFLNVTDTQSGGNGTVRILGPTAITAPGQATIYAHYDGQWLASSTISVMSTSSAVTSLTGATLTTTGYVANEYTVPTANASIRSITNGPDGNLWFTEENVNKIGTVTRTGAFAEYTIPTAASDPYEIRTGPDGNLWFVESSGNKIGKVTPSGNFTEYSPPTASSGPSGITQGSDGNMWFTEYNNVSNKIGKITMGGVFTEYTIPTANSQAKAIAAGSDGNLWFVENAGNNIGKITPSGSITEYAIPTAAAHPFDIMNGPDGNMWFTENTGNKIGKITPSGSITEYTVPTGASSPFGIASGPDGAIWFIENNSNKIGRLTTDGITFNEWTIPTGASLPKKIWLGSDGNMWFTEVNSNKIGRFTY